MSVGWISGSAAVRDARFSFFRDGAIAYTNETPLGLVTTLLLAATMSGLLPLLLLMLPDGKTKGATAARAGIALLLLLLLLLVTSLMLMLTLLTLALLALMPVEAETRRL
jgi:hypothetical protein